MDYKELGRAGIKVSPICLGNMNFGGSADEATSRRIMEHAVDKGVNFFDTANVYQKQESERILGRWLKDGGSARRDPLVIATKVYGNAGPNPNDRGLSRRHITWSCEQSLQRLQLDRIDLFQCHHWDTVPIEETIRAMDDLIRAGQDRLLGHEQLQSLAPDRGHAQGRARGAGLSGQRAMPVLNDQSARRNELAPFCMKFGVRMMPYSPLNAGRLSGIYRKGKPIPTRRGTRASTTGNRWRRTSTSSNR
jgi:aryl-alcohol dehydrogenase-like predicted oxidoreductase